MKSSGSRGSASAPAPAPVDPSISAVEALKDILVSNCEGLHKSAIDLLLTKGLKELMSDNTTPSRKLPVYQISTDCDCYLNLDFGTAIPFTDSLVMTAGHVDLSEDDLKQYKASYDLFGLSDSLDFQFLTPNQPGQRIKSFTYRGQKPQPQLKYDHFFSFDNNDTVSKVTIEPIKPINEMFCCISRSSADGEWVPGQSGTLIGGLNGDGKYDALYMVLARRKGNHLDAIGLCLPSMLGMMLDLKNIIDYLRPLKVENGQKMMAEHISMDVPPVLRALALYSACYEKLDHDDFELITAVSVAFKEKMEKVNGEHGTAESLDSWLISKITTFSALMKLRRSRRFNGNDSINAFNEFDKLVIKKAIKLKNTKIMKGVLLMECKDKDGDCNDDSCWICECEKDENGGDLYKVVWNKVIDKIRNAGVEYPKFAATEWETVNKQFTYWNKSKKPVKMKDFSSVTAGVTMKSGVVGHHPLICERNPHNFGIKVSHVCFRPSHLNRISKACNNLCMYLQFIDDEVPDRPISIVVVNDL
jgi:hypothetical protein